jgi:hypothetical protein
MLQEFASTNCLRQGEKRSWEQNVLAQEVAIDLSLGGLGESALEAVVLVAKVVAVAGRLVLEPERVVRGAGAAI